MNYNKFKCLECGHELIGNKDGLSCPECRGPIAPIRKASCEEIEQYRKEIENKKPPRINYTEVLNKQIVELEQLQIANRKSSLKLETKVDIAVKIAEEIRYLCDSAKKMLS